MNPRLADIEGMQPATVAVLEEAGYQIILHVHDEVVAEVPERFGHPDEFARLMTRTPSWALDLPIAAKAWTGKHYTK